MKTQEFLNLLQNNPNKSLLFEYAPNLLVAANYHITEVKHIAVDSVDCGAQTDSWKETIIQLWESPSELGKTEFMSAYKALAILNKVGKMKTYVADAEVKIEYGNSTFHATQLFVDDFEVRGTNLIIKLSITKTDCKAKELCGLPEEPKQEQSCCSPSSGCC
ncbi:MAG: hypothetical protein HRT69_00275 [Flavobacteriaceae bacterium]|nr:hypothetical protein [Flavobacteriaceae bacterium]